MYIVMAERGCVYGIEHLHEASSFVAHVGVAENRRLDCLPWHSFGNYYTGAFESVAGTEYPSQAFVGGIRYQHGVVGRFGERNVERRAVLGTLGMERVGLHEYVQTCSRSGVLTHAARQNGGEDGECVGELFVSG